MMNGSDQLNRSVETDILVEAANAQFRAADFLGPGVLRAVAPAKVNLFLGIGERREDGLHQAVTVMHTLSMHDTVYVNALPLSASASDEAAAAVEQGSTKLAFGGPGGSMLVSIDLVDKTSSLFATTEPLQVRAEDNLCFKAVDRLARACGRLAPEQVRIRLEKHVPAQAGLGGGSSDAAAVLVCLAKLWEMDDDRLFQEVAKGLGADVPFFLKGGCALLNGAGEHFVRSLTPANTPLVVVKPSFGVATAAAYSAFDDDPLLLPEGLLAQAEAAQAAGEAPLFNNLTKAAEQVCPDLVNVREWLTSQRGIYADRVLMSGSGSAFFAEAESFAEASRVAAAAQQEGLWARATSFSKLRAQVV